jgi:hypothetical protein
MCYVLSQFEVQLWPKIRRVRTETFYQKLLLAVGNLSTL